MEREDGGPPEGAHHTCGCDKALELTQAIEGLHLCSLRVHRHYCTVTSVSVCFIGIEGAQEEPGSEDVAQGAYEIGEGDAE